MKLSFLKCLITNLKFAEAFSYTKNSQIWTPEQVHGKETYLKQQKTISTRISPTSKGQCNPQAARGPGLVKLAHPPEFIA